MPDMREQVQHFAPRLASSRPTDASDAWHSLVELGPDALPFVIEAAETTSNRAVRCGLITVLSQHRSTQAVAFLGTMLRHDDGETWKTALDVLVAVGGPDVVRALSDAREISDEDRRSWIDEAIQQITE